MIRERSRLILSGFILALFAVGMLAAAIAMILASASIDPA